MRIYFKFKKKHFLYTFCSIVVALSLVRCFFPSVVGTTGSKLAESPVNEAFLEIDSIEVRKQTNDSLLLSPRSVPTFVNHKGERVKHKIYSVSSFKNSFPDLNDVQLATAERLGVKPSRDRQGAESRKGELVYVGSSPYFYVENLKHSIPYLVPRASNLLNHIGRTFLDSLEIKNIPLNTLIVTSVMRTDEDVSKLRQRNGNASVLSCHRYGTTFDICYNRYRNVYDPDGPEPRQVRNDSLKWVLSEVLNDQRKLGTCYVKYEVKQGCFHITVR